jgi:hypothetical protein
MAMQRWRAQANCELVVAMSHISQRIVTGIRVYVGFGPNGWRMQCDVFSAREDEDGLEVTVHHAQAKGG